MAESGLLQALAQDLGRPPLEAYFELVGVREELQFTRRHLKRWMAGQRIGLPPSRWPARGRLQPEPLGCVLIRSWPLTEPPISPTFSERPSPPQVVQVVQGDGQVGAQLLEHRFDHILFTGGGRVGRLVMAAAARHLTPVTLELGGKSPAIVLADAPIATTARQLVWGKGLNAGQTSVAPDHLLVVPEVVAPLKAAIARVQAGPKPLAPYLFDKRAQDRERVHSRTSSGSLAFNDVIVQVAVPQLPLGGVGESGMGAYHGHTGFLTFSHQRSILEQRFWPDIALRYQPYAGKWPFVKQLIG